MPDEREPLTGDDDLTESARRLSDALDGPTQFERQEDDDFTGEFTGGDDGLDLGGVKLSPGFGWNAYAEDSPVDRIGGRVRYFRRLRFSFGTPPLKGGLLTTTAACVATSIRWGASEPLCWRFSWSSPR